MSIPGEPGVDFPVYSAVPDTGFDCAAQTFPGIYGDVDGNCQVFHMCAPNGNDDSCKSAPLQELPYRLNCSRLMTRLHKNPESNLAGISQF